MLLASEDDSSEIKGKTPMSVYFTVFFIASLNMHFVYSSMDYPTLDEAANRPYGLAVVGTIFEVSPESNPVLQSLFNLLPAIRYQDTEILLPAMSVRSLLPRDISQFYRYLGSLTTPPCYSSVVWTLLKDRAKVSENQLKVLRAALTTKQNGIDTPLINNFRPPQPLYSRTVEVCAAPAVPQTVNIQPLPPQIQAPSQRLKPQSRFISKYAQLGRLVAQPARKVKPSPVAQQIPFSRFKPVVHQPIRIVKPAFSQRSTNVEVLKAKALHRSNVGKQASKSHQRYSRSEKVHRL